MDGSSMGNPGYCGIGGVIRDASSGMVQAYASHIGFGSNNKAELMALLHGLRSCKSLNISNVIVEMDSMHVFREGNRVADWLSKVGASGSD
ncbi:14.7 kDa ribonuclease H-like protein [Juglans regia]|uniref:14.7 kDa ribonuclease H-like protein n=1 Tax=Juglans regia TaxID=51240 RepID=A0A2I4E5Q4_JUGRE|nr:14.7 kDa ribonuclease H-like protein [Juglans regia]